MALTPEQILNSLILLGLPGRVDVAAGYTGGDAEAFRKSAVARKLLEQLDAAQEAKVVAVLGQYATVEFDTDTIQAEGLDSSAARTRRRLARMLAQAIGLTYGGGSGLRIERA